MFDSVRTRLTLWYVGVLALVLVAFSVGVYEVVTAILYDSLDTELRATMDETNLSLVHAIDAEKEEERLRLKVFWTNILPPDKPQPFLIRVET